MSIPQHRRFCTALHWSGRHGKEKAFVPSGKQTPLFEPASGYFTELLPLLKQLNIIGLYVKVKVNKYHTTRCKCTWRNISIHECDNIGAML